MQAAKNILRQMQQTSRTHYDTAALQHKQELAELVNKDSFDVTSFTPLELFFIAESVPPMSSKINGHLLAHGYAAALQQLPADWWGYPGSVNSTVAGHFTQLPQAATALKPLLLDQTPLRYEDGESNAMTKSLQWQLGDLAGGLAAYLQHREFDFRAPLEKRLAVRQELFKNIP